MCTVRYFSAVSRLDSDTHLRCSIKGQENFEGKLIHYASTEFKTWVQVLGYFTNEVIDDQTEEK